jgi:chemotaxis protein methyltransferase CheR
MDATLIAMGEITDGEIARLLDAVLERYHHDFRGYAVQTMRRRILATMRRLGIDDADELQRRVFADPADFAVLLDHLTVRVSEMFRDPAWFANLRTHVVPRLVERDQIRIWVAGCADGEEAWSLAILLAEAGALSRSRIYATDIDPTALERARSGIFPLDRVARYSRNYHDAGCSGSLSDHFTAAYGGARFSRALGERIVFADHSLATDQVFAEVDLVTCRNVLIYFERTLQDRAIGLFREALPPGGFLGLGAKESLLLSTHGAAFEEIFASARIWRRRDV